MSISETNTGPAAPAGASSLAATSSAAASPPKILIVDDEPPIVQALEYNLRREGYSVVSADNGSAGIGLFESENPDLVILDVMLPGLNGIDVCRILRKNSDTPIIMLTARAEETDRVVGLEIGADDYVTKPFSMRELMARVKGILRRTAGHGESLTAAPIDAQGIVIDSERFEVTVQGKRVELTRREFQLLRFFASHRGQVFSRQTLLDRVWGTDAYVEDRTVDVHMRWLREKIEDEPSRPKRLLTVRGVGYKFV